jgi:hypothetical protein
MASVEVVLDYNVGGFVDDEVIEWLESHVGHCVSAHKSNAVGLGWYLQRVVNDGHNVRETYIFDIQDSQKAMLFKLRWS